MANADTQQKPRFPRAALARPDYAPGSYLGSRDLLAGQHYLHQRLRRHNRHLHGWGVVCGLRVVPARDPGRPWAVHVCPGYALGPYGDEIEVPAPVIVDLRDYLWTRPPQRRTVSLAYLGIRSAEE